MSDKSATILDVARHLGINASTVSRALNPKTRSMVKTETIERVEAAARELNYWPNRLASALKKKQSHSIGILIPDLMNPVFPPIIRGIEEALEEAGYRPIIANTDNEDRRKRDAVNSMRAQFVDGLIIAAASLVDPVVEECIRQAVPLVTINRTVGGHRVSAVITDERFGIRAAVDHLVSLGHQKIAHVAGPMSLSTGETRCSAYKEALQDHGIEIDIDLIGATEAFTEEEGQRAFGELLDRGGFTAVIAGNDLIALGCLDALQVRGLSCPKDMSVIGYNNMPLTDRISPPLTTVGVPHFEMGRMAARTILEQIDDPDLPVKTIQLKPEFLIRASTAPPYN